MEPGPPEAAICQRDEKTDSGKVSVSFRLVGRAVCKGADTGVLIVDEVDKIRVTVMEARGQRLVLDDAVQLDCDCQYGIRAQ